MERKTYSKLLLGSRSCWASPLSQLRLRHRVLPAGSPRQVDAVNFSHVTGEIGASLGSRRKESSFLRQKAAGWLSSPGESSGSLFAWLVVFVVVILVGETRKVPEGPSGALIRCQSKKQGYEVPQNGETFTGMSRFSEAHPKDPVLGLGFWEPGLAAVHPTWAGSFISLPKQRGCLHFCSESWYCRRGKNKSNEGSVFHLTMRLWSLHFLEWDSWSIKKKKKNNPRLRYVQNIAQI